MNAQIQLGRSDCLHLREFCRQHNVGWYVEKHNAYGAYVGAGERPFHFFRGCNPNVGPFALWWKKSREMFGEANYREPLPMDWLDAVQADENIVVLEIQINSLRVEAFYKRA